MANPPDSKVKEAQKEYSGDPIDLREVDWSQLERNLTLTPDQRISEHQRALELVLHLEKAGKALRERPK